MDQLNKQEILNEYKISLIRKDIEYIKQLIIPKKWEKIPIIGALGYAQRLKYGFRKLNKGVLYKELYKGSLLWMFLGLIVIGALLIIIVPSFLRGQTNFGIKKTEQIIEKMKKPENIT